MTTHSKRLIQEMARHLGIAASAIRYYEKTGVVRRPPRSTGQFRIYGDPEERALRQVLSLRALGLSLREIRALQANSRHGEENVAAEIRLALQRHIDETSAQLRALTERRRWLRRLRDCQCPGKCETLLEAHTILPDPHAGRAGAARRGAGVRATRAGRG